jgi:hypothetical protein
LIQTHCLKIKGPLFCHCATEACQLHNVVDECIRKAFSPIINCER